MTTEELREIDGRLSIMLFGGKWIALRGKPERWLVSHIPCVDGWIPVRADYGRRADDWDRSVPRYSSDLAAAWKIIELYRNRWRTEDSEENYWQFTDCQEYGWRVDVMWAHHDGDVSLHSAAAETFPLAISQVAVLLAAEEE